MGQKLGGVGVPFFLGVAASPSNTKSPGPRPTSIPNGNVAQADAYLRTKRHLDPSSRLATADMGRKCGGLLCSLFSGARSQSNTDMTDNGPIAQGEPFYKRSPKNQGRINSSPTAAAPANTGGALSCRRRRRQEIEGIERGGVWGGGIPLSTWVVSGDLLRKF